MAAEEPAHTAFEVVLIDARGPDETNIICGGRHALQRWQRAGVEVAVIASAAGAALLPDGVTTVIDPSAAPTLEHSVHLYGEATLQMEAGPSDALVLAWSETSVAAARALGFRRIVGISRTAAAQPLLDAGASSTVSDLTALRFPRALPAALECLEEIERWRDGRSPAVFLDFDGTLTPIVAHPDDAVLAPEMRHVVARLAERFPVAVISGRDREDVARRVGIDDIYYAGSHGLDIAGPGRTFNPGGLDEHLERLDAAAAALDRNVRPVSGVVIEHKRFSLAVHTRQVADTTRSREVREETERLARAHGLRVRRGKQVRELVPAVDWHKGRALNWLRQELAIDPAHTWLLYAGDDETDEDAFQALGPDGLGLRPGPRVAATLADYQVMDVDEVRRFLEWLAA